LNLKLTWGIVDLQHGFITLAETKNGEKREIPINNTLRETINKLPRRVIEKAGKSGEKVNTGLSPVFIKLLTVSRMG
jgi:hypothetical protein